VLFLHKVTCHERRDFRPAMLGSCSVDCWLCVPLRFVSEEQLDRLTEAGQEMLGSVRLTSAFLLEDRYLRFTYEPARTLAAEGEIQATSRSER
jgi:hypothetical protein